MTFDSLVLSKIHLQDVPKLSSFVDRSLKAMLPAGSDDERLHRLQDLAAVPWTRDRIVEPYAASRTVRSSLMHCGSSGESSW